MHVEVDARPAVRTASVRWCLRALDLLEELVTGHGRFDPSSAAAQLDDHRAHIAAARRVYAALLDEV